MNKIASMRAAGELIKTASAVMMDQQREIEALRAELDALDLPKTSVQGFGSGASWPQ